MATLKYRDKTDRAYGLTGMSVCMCLMESEQFIRLVDLDAEADYGMEFTPDFYQARNQGLSAKAVWRGNLERFRLLTGLVVANTMCRALVRNREEVGRELSDLLLRHLQTEADELCSLQSDETRSLFAESFNFFHRVFTHPQVSALVEEFVEQLQAKRRLESEAVIHILRPLIGA